MGVGLLVEVTAAGLAQIEEHLAQFPDLLDEKRMYRPNEEMLKRLRSGQRSKVDLRFYEHELIESQLRSEGLTQEDSHVEALRRQGLESKWTQACKGEFAGFNAFLYHLDVMISCQGYFNDADRALAQQMQKYE